MLHVEPKDIPTNVAHAYLLGGVAPRPIALVSTLSKEGIRNLSPFSFFNAFGANPPTVAFSPARRNRDGSFKHTYRNLAATKECVIQAVTYSMLHQINLASAEWAEGVDEFTKSGLTPVASDLVKPPRVDESPYQMECVLQQIIPLGNSKGSGNLAICEIVKFHIAEDLLEGNIIQPERIDLVARMGGDWYTRASGKAVFKLAKPGDAVAIGYDNLPAFIKRSTILSANNLAQLAGCTSMPVKEEAEQFVKSQKQIDYSLESFERYHRLGDYKEMLKVVTSLEPVESAGRQRLLELTAKEALDRADDRDFAWKVLVYLQSLNSE